VNRRHCYTIAHRGLSGRHAENTMDAFEAALAHTRMIELDVRATADCVLVCLHDPTLERCHGDERRVGQVTWSELQQIAPEVPRLEDVLGEFGDQAGWFIDCKVSRPRAIGELERVAHRTGIRWDTAGELRAGEPLPLGHAAFESAHAEVLQGFGSRNRAGCVELIRGESAAMELTLGAPFVTAYAHGVVLPDSLAHHRMLRLLGALRLGTYVYTVNELERLEELCARGACGVFTDVADECCHRW
jgi:glycerophosphoryl diester phosphodiesterase